MRDDVDLRTVRSEHVLVEGSDHLTRREETVDTPDSGTRKSMLHAPTRTCIPAVSVLLDMTDHAGTRCKQAPAQDRLPEDDVPRVVLDLDDVRHATTESHGQTRKQVLRAEKPDRLVGLEQLTLAVVSGEIDAVEHKDLPARGAQNAEIDM